ncbi:hypothetical protein SCB29_28955 [Paraburkholderia sp. SIMBA_055]
MASALDDITAAISSRQPETMAENFLDGLFMEISRSSGNSSRLATMGSA